MGTKRVLILTASFGDGHNTAARSLRDAIEHVDPGARVDVLDLIDVSYKPLNAVLKHAYLGMVRYVPRLWGGVYQLLNKSAKAQRGYLSLARLRHTLGDILQATEPDCVVSTFPLYSQIIQELYREHRDRPFRLVTVVTDSISINAAWFRAPSDVFVVPNEATAEVLCRAGVTAGSIRALGFPVSHRFCVAATPIGAPTDSGPRKVLYLLNTGRRKTGRLVDNLLDIPRLELTITTGRDARLRAKLAHRYRDETDRVHVLGWTDQMPELLLSHHLLIAKAGGAVVQEAIAARCPILVNQIIPGQEEGNAELIRQAGIGAIAKRNRDLPSLVRSAFSRKASLWRSWRAQLETIARPDAALHVARLVLEQETGPAPEWRARILTHDHPARPTARRSAGEPEPGRTQLCDLHVHSTYSDGKLTIPELIDFYGRRGFDCLCITDHLADPHRLVGKLCRLTGLVLNEAQYGEYFEIIRREAGRAWRQYRMLVMAGIEFNKDGLTRKSSAHLLGIDLTGPIDSGLDLDQTIEAIHGQGGLAVASHPHIMRSEWGRNTLLLWEQRERFAPLIDAWEIANRNNLFTPIGLQQLPYIANSDFHKPKHINSWKTLLHCEKDPEAIKECIRKNRHVSITLYRDPLMGQLPQPTPHELLPGTVTVPHETPELVLTAR